MASRSSRPLVLLAEDEAIIAIELDESLRGAGFAVAGPFSTCAQAEAWLETGEPDAAILDHALKDGPCDDLMRELSRRAVPTIVFTGHDAPRERPAELANAIWVTKPIAFPALLTQLKRRMRTPLEPPPKR
jgi:DNA-binding response OmpR family regulator